jgi:hypothetical protein
MPTAAVRLLHLVLLAIALLFGTRPIHAGECARCFDSRDLSRMCQGQLDALFTGGSVGCMPVGDGRGRALLVVDARHPRFRAALVDTVWKGKSFTPDGRMINRWAGGVRAVEAPVRVEPSRLDGKPCIVIDYPPDAAVFGGTWDELREISPGVFLGRAYERCPCPRLKTYFVVEMICRPSSR